MRIDVRAGQLPRKLREAARRAGNLRGAWEVVGEIVLNSIRRNFDVGGRPTPWAPRSTLYPGRRANNKLLIDTGRLINSIAKRAANTYVEVGTNVIYAATHQFGRGSIPARPFLMVQAEDWPEIETVLRDAITRPFL